MEQVRIAKVSAVNLATGMVSVAFPDEDMAATGWIPYLTHGEEFAPPDIGMEVLVLSLPHGLVALGTYWNEKHPPQMGKSLWRKEIAEDTYMRYDTEKKALVIHAPKVVIETEDGTVDLHKLAE